MTALNGQVLGTAENAVRALLVRHLTPLGLDYHQWVALNATAAGAPPDRIVALLIDGLKIDEGTVRATIDRLADRGLVDSGPESLTLTDAGRAAHAQVRTAVAGVTARLYGDLSPEDLETAGRVLEIVTARANEVLAAT